MYLHFETTGNKCNKKRCEEGKENEWNWSNKIVLKNLESSAKKIFDFSQSVFFVVLFNDNSACESTNKVESTSNYVYLLQMKCYFGKCRRIIELLQIVYCFILGRDASSR